MLRALLPGEFDDCVAFAWRLAGDLRTSAFPTYADGLKTREDFVDHARRSMAREDEEILLYTEDGAIEGWIQYFRLPADNYLQVQAFNVRRGAAGAIAEFTALMRSEYPGDTLYFGVPGENTAYREALARLGYAPSDCASVDVLRFEDYRPLPEDVSLVPVTRENFPLFRALHARVEADMYWNSDRLLAHLSDWHIWMRVEGERARGAIYFRGIGGSLEIFGADFADGAFDEDLFRALMIRALNAGKALGATDLCYFNDAREHPAVAALGFRHVCEYRLFTLRL